MSFQWRDVSNSLGNRELVLAWTCEGFSLAISGESVPSVYLFWNKRSVLTCKKSLHKSMASSDQQCFGLSGDTEEDDKKGSSKGLTAPSWRGGGQSQHRLCPPQQVPSHRDWEHWAGMGRAINSPRHCQRSSCSRNAGSFHWGNQSGLRHTGPETGPVTCTSIMQLGQGLWPQDRMKWRCWDSGEGWGRPWESGLGHAGLSVPSSLRHYRSGIELTLCPANTAVLYMGNGEVIGSE